MADGGQVLLMDSEIKYRRGSSSAYADGYVDMLNNAELKILEEQWERYTSAIIQQIL